MATGFRPKSERIIELRGYSTDDLVLLAVEAARYLGWQMGTVRCDKAEFYTPTSFWSWQEKVTLSRVEGKDGQLLATSMCTFMQIIDWGKNKSNLKKLVAAMQRLQSVHTVSSTAFGAGNRGAASYTAEEKNAVLSHIRRFYGCISGQVTESDSSSGVEVLIIKPTNRFDYYTLITCGAGSSVMPVPDKDLPSRGEFCICMPPEWNPEEQWPVEWLLRCASLARTGDEWMTCSHILSDGTPLHSDTSMTAVLLTIPEGREEGAETCQLPGGDSVTFYQLVPVYAEEADFRQANGFLALLEKMKDVSHIADTERENTCKEFVPWSEADGDEISMDEKANTSLRSVLTFRKGNMATPLLVYINVALFLIMAACGVSLVAPTGLSIIKWGANFGPLTLTGDWWRTITCNFIHIGLIHILMNMYALLYIGVYLEQFIGWRRVLTAYFLTGLFAALSSLMIHPEVISAGASGSIFGLYGIFLSYLMFHHKIEKGQRKSLLYSIGFFVVYNLLMGAREEGIDNAAHIGGLASGFILGAVYLLADLYGTSRKNANLVSYVSESVFALIFVFLFGEQVLDRSAEYAEIRRIWDDGTLEEYAQAFAQGEGTSADDSEVYEDMAQDEETSSVFTGSDKNIGNGMREYINDACGFRCTYPFRWMVMGKSDTDMILRLGGQGANSFVVNHVKASSEEEMEQMRELLFKSMDGFGAEEIHIDGKAFKKISGVMEYPVAGGGTIKVNQSIVFHLNSQTLEGYILVIITSDDTYESEAQAILESIRIKS